MQQRWGGIAVAILLTVGWWAFPYVSEWWAEDGPPGQAEDGTPEDDARNYIDWEIRPVVTRGFLEFAGNIKEARRAEWTLCADDWSRFAIYRWPQPSVGYGQTISPVGSLLEPLGAGEFYDAIPRGGVVADGWRVDCDSFHIRARVSSAWPSAFSVGIWGQSRTDSQQWAHLGEVKAAATSPSDP